MDDLISRAWLLSEYDKRHKGPPGGARKLIEEAPSAQPKRGRWNYNSKIGTFKVWTCDQCGWNYEAEYNFCPNCGADMREVTE